MKTFRMLLAAMVASAGIAGVAAADPVTFVFRPNDFMERYPPTWGDGVSPGQTKADQPDARRFIDRDGAGATLGTYETYDGASDYATWLNWRNSLGPGEGIRAFSVWPARWTAMTSFGQDLYLVNYNAGSGDATGAWAPAGWHAEVEQTAWNPIWYFWTDDPAMYIRPGGPDLGVFSFSGNCLDLAFQPVEVGADYRVMFWVYGDEMVFAGGSVDDEFNFIANVTAVPEPAAIWLLAVGIAALAIVVRRRRGS